MNAYRRFLLIFLAVATLLAAPARAYASIMVAPTRVVFEDRARSSTLLLLNTDNKQHSYRIGWRIMKADESGNYHDEMLDPNDPRSVANMVVYSPRQLTIEPNGRQNVRLSLRRPADLPPGEYRAHMTFQALPDDDLAPGGERKAVSMKLKVVVGVSIPIIVRVGGSMGTVSIDDIGLKVLEDHQPALALSIKHPLGSNSAYGQVEVLLQKSGGETQVGVLNNVALYPEQEKRILMIPLLQPLPSGSRVKIVYNGGGEYNGQVLAEKQLTIQ